MSPLDWLLAALIAALVGAAAYFAFRRKKSGSCCGDCGKCSVCPACKGKKEDGEKKN